MLQVVIRPRRLTKRLRRRLKVKNVRAELISTVRPQLVLLQPLQPVQPREPNA
jgi:hypothetical protein